MQHEATCTLESFFCSCDCDKMRQPIPCHSHSESFPSKSSGNSSSWKWHCYQRCFYSKPDVIRLSPQSGFAHRSVPSGILFVLQSSLCIFVLGTSAEALSLRNVGLRQCFFATMYDIGSVNTAHVLWSRFHHQTDRQSKTDKKLSWDLLLFEPEVVSFGI